MSDKLMRCLKWESCPDKCNYKLPHKKDWTCTDACMDEVCDCVPVTICPDCKGTGKHYVSDGYEISLYEDCPTCKGSDYVDVPDNTITIDSTATFKEQPTGFTYAVNNPLQDKEK